MLHQSDTPEDHTQAIPIEVCGGTVGRAVGFRVGTVVMFPVTPSEEFQVSPFRPGLGIAWTAGIPPFKKRPMMKMRERSIPHRVIGDLDLKIPSSSPSDWNE